jgi:hypothetical protein
MLLTYGLTVTEANQSKDEQIKGGRVSSEEQSITENNGVEMR